MNEARDSQERGSVLFLSLLITLVLSGILVLSLERTAVEMAMVGNERFSLVGYHVADSGLTSTIAKAWDNPTAFLDPTVAVPQSDGTLLVTMAALFDDTTNPDPVEPFGDSGNAYDGTFGREGAVITRVNFETALTNEALTNRVPGFSAEDTCFKRFLWTTTGEYGLDDGSGTGGVVAGHRLAVRRARTSGYVGPVACDL